MLAFAALLALTGAPEQAAQPSCPHLSGAEMVLADQSKRYVIVGERHGTNEIPALFSDLVCAAASIGPVVVGLEIEADQQKSLDEYMASEGDQAARDGLLAQRHWGYTDGRASQAMFQVVENLRLLRQKGKQILLRALMPAADTPEARELGMGMAWKQSLRGNENAKLLMLVGSVHAEREPLGRFIPAAHSLPASETITLSYFPSDSRAISREVPAQFRWPRFNMWYSVGRPFTSSPRAKPGVSR